jgi:hypothetical protein
MPTRRRGTIKKNVRLTEEGIAAIQQWADDNGVSFSAALESLARSGLGQQHDEAFAPVLISVLNRTMQQNYKSIVRIIIAVLVEALSARLMAGASTRHVVQLHEQLATGKIVPYEQKDRYQAIKTAVNSQAFVTLKSRHIQRLINELGLVYADDTSTPKS